MDDIVETVVDSQSVLLPEILSHIFAYLPLTDRKEVRRTCRSWYMCSVRLNIIKSEKYVFRTHDSVEEIAELMMRSNYSQLNLEFQGVPVKELPTDVWQVGGERIQTLEFYECQWNAETMRNVILHCTNVTSIVIKSTTSCQKATCPIKLLCSCYLLDGLLKKGLRRSKLRTFATFDKGVQLPESVLKKVFLLFPGIEHFSMGLVDFEIDEIVYYPILSLREPPLSLRLDQCFSPETRLESLTLNVLTDGNLIETLVQLSEQGIRLKKLEMILIYQKSMKDSLFDFFKSQRNLEDVKLGILEAYPHENKELFFHILDNCPKLQEFFIDTESDGILLKPSELPRFIASTSKLKFLSVLYVYHGTPTPLYHDLLAEHAELNLTSLRWDNLDCDFGAAFLPRCPSLLHLQFDGCRDSTLQIIFQFLGKLRTLVLYGIHRSCTDYGFTGRGVDGRQEGFSIKRLHHLEYLQLQAAGSLLTAKSTLELQLPRLEFLSLNETWFKELRSEESLDHFASHLPELRVLAIHEYFSRFLHVMTVRVCLRLKKLYRLICSHGYFIHDDEEMAFAEEIFKSCPSSRYVCIVGIGVFSRNPVTENVFRSDWRSFKFPGNVFEGELSDKCRHFFK